MDNIIDAHDGVVTRYYEEEGKSILVTTQDVEKVVNANKERQQVAQTGGFRLIADIPAVIFEKWMNDDGVNLCALPKRELAAYVNRKINDPDWQWMKSSRTPPPYQNPFTPRAQSASDFVAARR